MSRCIFQHIEKMKDLHHLQESVKYEDNAEIRQYQSLISNSLRFFIQSGQTKPRYIHINYVIRHVF
jgi:hypothetical protein